MGSIGSIVWPCCEESPEGRKVPSWRCVGPHSLLDRCCYLLLLFCPYNILSREEGIVDDQNNYLVGRPALYCISIVGIVETYPLSSLLEHLWLLLWALLA